MTREYPSFDDNAKPVKQKMSYQDAKSIRKKSVAKLLLDELMEDDSTVASSVKKTISDKTKATVTGIKQTFDPMNLVKMMTFGSNLGPALFGKMTGRSQEDMSFFAGKSKAKQVGEKATKIGQVEGGGDEGFIAVLSQIYSLLKKSHEDETLKNEMDKNKSEDREHDAERRHQELLKALGGVSDVSKATSTAVKESGDSAGGIIGFITQFVENTFGMKISEIGDMVTKITSMAAFLAPVLGAGLSIFAPAFIAQLLRKSLSADAGKSDPIESKDYTLSKPISQMSTSEKLAGAIGAKRQSIEETIENGMDLMKDGRGHALFSAKEAEDIKKFYEIDVPKELIKTAEKVEDKAKSGTPASTPAATPASAPGTPATQTPSAQPVAPKTATPASPTPTSAPVNTSITENNNLKIQEKTNNTADNTVTNNKVVNMQSHTAVAMGPLPAIRNTESTFQRMIYASTRVV